MTNELQWQQDLALVQQTLARDREAIAELATRMKCIPVFLNSMNHHVHQPLSREKLEDAGQEVAARIWRDRELFTGHSRVETWVYPYAKHVFRESVAAQSRNDYRRADHDTIHSLYSAEPTVSEALEIQSEAARVRRAMESLDPELVLLIERHLLLGHSFPKIAEEESLNLNTVKARYYRAMTALRESLSQPASPNGDSRSRSDSPPDPSHP